MNESNKLILARIEIEEPLQDIITDEFKSIAFECKINDGSKKIISYKWYKDGKLIEPSRRVKLSYDGKWFRLEIASVMCNDYGVYVILLNNNFSQIYSTANLYVNEVKDTHSNDMLFIGSKNLRFDVVKHLRCAKVLVGDTIELEARFNADIIGDYVWYKSNRTLLPNERTIILDDKRTTTLSILYAKETDTGIYHVVCKSQYGIASSFSSVVVVNTDIITLNASEISPSIDEPLSEELEANEGEGIRLMCKATYDVNTVIQWSKNGINIDENEKITTEYYNNKYTCLRIKNTCIEDSGKYSILMRDEITGHTDTSNCFLTVNHNSMEKLSPVKLRTPLQPIVTCIGYRLSFFCSFILDDPKLYYVVWYVGHHNIERSNHQFHVLNSGGDFFLIINQVEPGMAGEVTCELHKARPCKTSIIMNSTATNLTIVPPTIMNKELKLNNAIIKRNLYRNVNSKLIVPVMKTKDEFQIQKPINSTSCAHFYDGSTVVTYCRLDNDNFYLDVTNGDYLNEIDRIAIYEQSIDIAPPNHKSIIVIIEWYNMDINKSDSKWYEIKFRNIKGDFVEAGFSNEAMFELKDPPLEQIMNFRIDLRDSLHNSNESKVCILPIVKELKVKNQCELKPMEVFDSMFKKTGDIIGCGAYGTVVLVRDSEGEFYAAKILKTRIQKKRDAALREYEIMKMLRHQKLVELHSAYASKESFILVMDYLWGGELFDRIVEEEHFKEIDVVRYVKQICEALQYLHNQQIAHLDLKPENIICLSPNSRQVKIIDFGLAKVLDGSHVIRGLYGTPDYVAPEVLNFEQLTLACDMWSLGVITYMLLAGVLPFSGDSWLEHSSNITKGNYNSPESALKDISELGKNFVDHLLILQPEKRMNASCALNHKWIVDGPPKGEAAGHMKQTRQNLKTYLAKNRARWQRAGNVMIAAHRLRNAGSLRNTLNTDRVSPHVT